MLELEECPDILSTVLFTTVGANVIKVLKRLGLQKGELAKRLRLAQPTVSIFLHAETTPDPETIIKYANALGCPTSELMEDVMTEYDQLRADKRVLDEGAEPLRLTVPERRLIEDWRVMSKKDKAYYRTQIRDAAADAREQLASASAAKLAAATGETKKKKPGGRGKG